jgi:hypothetical protein
VLFPPIIKERVDVMSNPTLTTGVIYLSTIFSFIVQEYFGAGTGLTNVVGVYPTKCVALEALVFFPPNTFAFMPDVL